MNMNEKNSKTFFPDSEIAPRSLSVMVFSIIIGIFAFGITLWGIFITNKYIIICGISIFLFCLLIGAVSFVLHNTWIVRRLWRKYKDGRQHK